VLNGEGFYNLNFSILPAKFPSSNQKHKTIAAIEAEFDRRNTHQGSRLE